MAGAPPRRRDSPPALPDELVEEILLRLPPDEPAWLLRASLISKAWGGAIASPAFRRRLHEFHRSRTPPVLGFLRNRAYAHAPRFIPTTASSFSLAAPDCASWRALDCRHGRALFLSKGQDTLELLVWEPITGGKQLVPVPALCKSRSGSAAVFCASDVCDHRDCHGSPFQLVLLFNGLDYRDEQYGLLACVYSSETGTWGEPASLHGELGMCFTDYSPVLVRRSLLYFMSDDGFIVEYDLARRSLAVFDALDMNSDLEEPENVNLVLAEDGGMRVIQVLYTYLKFWKREAMNGTDAQWWVITRVIDLGNFLLQIGVVLAEGTEVRVVGFAEEANVILVDTVGGIFTVDLQSEKARKVCDDYGFSNLIPVVGFYTPVPRVESGPSEETCDEKGGEEEKAVDQPPQLFDKGSNAIEEGDFINAFECVSRDLKIRNYEEDTLEGVATTLNRYGCTLLPKDQEVVNLSGDLPKSAPNEESVKRTSSQDDARNSTSFGERFGERVFATK